MCLLPEWNRRHFSRSQPAEWLTTINATLEGKPHAPFGINLIVHKTNPRLEADLKITVEHKVPFVITSLGAVSDLVESHTGRC